MNTLFSFKISNFLLHICLFSFLCVFVIIVQTVNMAMMPSFSFVNNPKILSLKIFLKDYPIYLILFGINSCSERWSYLLSVYILHFPGIELYIHTFTLALWWVECTSLPLIGNCLHTFVFSTRLQPPWEQTTFYFLISNMKSDI